MESSGVMSHSQLTDVRSEVRTFALRPHANQSRYFRHITSGVNVAPALAELQANPHLWVGQQALIEPTPYDAEAKYIWLRYRDLDDYVRKYGRSGDHFADEHESVWPPPAALLPYTAKLAAALAGPRRLGGVLLSYLPPKCGIKPHIDAGWHAAAHDKLYCALQVRPGARFCWEDGAIDAQDGDVYCFRDDALHWEENDSDAPRVSMIVFLGRPN